MYRKTIILLISTLSIATVFGVHPDCVGYANIRSVDGKCNNLNNPDWGRSGTPERRIAAPRYQDGKSIPVDGPNARTVSQRLFALSPQKNDLNKTFIDREYGPLPGLAEKLNMFAVLTLQFLTHDMAFTPLIFDPNDPSSNFGITIENCTPATSTLYDELCIWPAAGDPNALPFPQTALFTRPSDHTTINGVFTPFSNVSGFVDLSTVYGSDADTASKVRSHSQGKLLTGNNGEALPRASDIGVANDCGPFVEDGSGAGDTRVDENTGITTLHIAFLRMHNHICDELIALGFSGDEVIFQKARDLTVGIWQHIVFDELIPAVFGPTFTGRYLGPYNGYQSTVNPSIQIEGTTAGFRFHNLLNLPFLHVNKTCELVRGVVAVHPNIPVKIEEQDNCHPERFREVGSEIVLRGLLMQFAQTFDEHVTDAIRNLRLEAPGNVDVAASDIFRSRLHGLPDYNTLRQTYGLSSIYGSGCTAGTTMDNINCFRKITNNNTLAAELQSLYKKVNKIDPIIGIHAEVVPPHSVVTETAAAVELTQLKALRDGDRFYYDSYLPLLSRLYVKSKSMKDVLSIAFPTIASELRDDIFHVNKLHRCFQRRAGDPF